MSGTKSEKISISLPSALLAVVDANTANRSKYFQDLAEADMRRAGKLLPDPVAIELARFRELIAARGIEAVRGKLDELVEEAVVAGGGR